MKTYHFIPPVAARSLGDTAGGRGLLHGLVASPLSSPQPSSRGALASAFRPSAARTGRGRWVGSGRSLVVRAFPLTPWAYRPKFTPCHPVATTTRATGQTGHSPRSISVWASSVTQRGSGLGPSGSSVCWDTNPLRNHRWHPVDS